MTKLQDEDLNRLETLALLELRMLRLLDLTMEQRALLTEAVMTLKSRQSDYFVLYNFHDNLPRKHRIRNQHFDVN